MRNFALYVLVYSTKLLQGVECGGNKSRLPVLKRLQRFRNMTSIFEQRSNRALKFTVSAGFLNHFCETQNSEDLGEFFSCHCVSSTCSIRLALTTGHIVIIITCSNTESQQIRGSIEIFSGSVSFTSRLNEN